MTTDERLEVREFLLPEETSADTLIALHHRHRYRWAAALVEGRVVVDLCCGSGYGTRMLGDVADRVTGVDIDDDALRVARATHGAPGVDFVQSDALAYARTLSADRVGAVVCFEGIEHVPDPEALVAELARLAAGGTRVLVSLPNSRGFDEDNPFHEAQFGPDDALPLLRRLGEDVVLVSQFLAEGSVLLPADAPPPSEARVIAPPELADARWANHWLAVAGAEPERVAAETVALRTVAEPFHNQYMRALEQANAELRGTNTRLARRQLGRHDAAAASVLFGREQRIRALEAEVEELQERLAQTERDAAARLAREMEAARRNDELFQAARAKLERPQHRAVLAVTTRIERLPVLGRILARAWRWLT